MIIAYFINNFFFYCILNNEKLSVNVFKFFTFKIKKNFISIDFCMIQSGIFIL
jgi:hypothetical protein